MVWRKVAKSGDGVATQSTPRVARIELQVASVQPLCARSLLSGATYRSATTAGSTSRTITFAAIGPAVRSSLAGAISRQLKPKWAAPQGVDVDQLVTILAWDMNADGSLAGAPRVVRQEGIDDANRAQASRHAEQAVRAVRLAAPFNLPSEYYDAWKRVGSFRFDRKLSQ